MRRLTHREVSELASGRCYVCDTGLETRTRREHGRLVEFAICPSCAAVETATEEAEARAFRDSFPELARVNLAKLDAEEDEDRLVFVILVAILIVLAAIFA